VAGAHRGVEHAEVEQLFDEVLMVVVGRIARGLLDGATAGGDVARDGRNAELGQLVGVGLRRFAKLAPQLLKLVG
jgi:hypothetical protein